MGKYNINDTFKYQIILRNGQSLMVDCRIMAKYRDNKYRINYNTPILDGEEKITSYICPETRVVDEDDLIPSISEQLNDRQKEYYKQYPDIFIEEFFGIKLYPWQRFYLRKLIIKC